MTTEASASRPALPPEEEWVGAILDLIAGAVVSLVEDDRDRLGDALKGWHEWATENGCDHDGALAALVVSLAGIAGMAGAPCKHGGPGSCDGTCEGPVGVVMEDTRTGEIVADPEEEVTDESGAAALLATRMIVAKMNDDPGTAYALFYASTPEVGFRTLVLLAEMAAHVQLDEAARIGALPPDVAEKWAARKADAEKDAPEIRGPVEVREHDGIEFRSIGIDERDRHPDDRDNLVAPHGQALYASTAYPATAGMRERFAAMAHEQIRGWAASGRGSGDGPVTLCGVEHFEDIEPWQLPHTTRPSANRALRGIKRQTGIRGQLLRAWQHTGPCPNREEPTP